MVISISQMGNNLTEITRSIRDGACVISLGSVQRNRDRALETESPKWTMSLEICLSHNNYE